MRLLKHLYKMFNIDELCPNDFQGHSMSVSGVAAIKIMNRVSYYYMDCISFRQLAGFQFPEK